MFHHTILSKLRGSILQVLPHQVFRKRENTKIDVFDHFPAWDFLYG